MKANLHGTDDRGRQAGVLWKQPSFGKVDTMIRHPYIYELAAKARRQELLREAEQERLARRALAGRRTRQTTMCRMLAWLGGRLVTWGHALQERFAAERPFERLPLAGQPR